MRTNCMDCLDRTNVVQSVIARHLLWQFLGNIGVQRPGVLNKYELYLDGSV